MSKPTPEDTNDALWRSKLSEDDWRHLEQNWRSKKAEDPLFGRVVAERYRDISASLGN